MQKYSPSITGAIVLTILCGLVYLAVQQDMRQGANDPQIQIAHDVADALETGVPLQTIMQSTHPVDMGRSLSPFIIAYDESGKAAEGSGFLHASLPAMPAGVFEYARTHGEDRITWEPEQGVRNAAVLVHYRVLVLTGSSSTTGSGFILVGRSLQEVEKRENALMAAVAAAWIFGLAALIAWTMLSAMLSGIPGGKH